MSLSATRIYIGRISSRTRERDLERAFDRYGRILKLDMKVGFAFVEYEDPRDADDAIHEMDGRELDGQRISVERSKGPRPGGYEDIRGGGGFGGRMGVGPRGPPIRTDHRVVVENMDSYTSWQDLKDFARQAGQVLYTDVYQRDGKKYGVIEYASKSDMKEALRTLDDTRLGANYVRIVEENGTKGRSRSRSRSPRRRSPSASRSPVRRSSRRSRSRSRSPRRSRSRS